jgi:hypothetical protein
MTTRGVSSAPASEELPIIPDPSIGPDLETYVADLSLTEEVLHSIQRLPTTVAELRQASTVDVLTVHELQSVLQSLSIPVATIDFLKGGRSRDRVGQKKAVMLNLLATKFGEQWGALHDLLSQKKASAGGRRRKSGHDVPGLAFDTDRLDVAYRPIDAVLNDALSTVYQSGTLPARNSLIFLSDMEYESVKQFHAVMNPRAVEPIDSADGSDTAAIEYLFGTLKDTTAALEGYYELASTAQLYIEKLVKHHEERGMGYGDGKLFLSQGDQESSEEQGELGNE